MLLHPAKEFILQPSGFLIVLDGTHGPCQGASTPCQPALPLLGSGRNAITPVVTGMVGIPPHAHIHTQVAQGLEPIERLTFPIGGESFFMDQVRPDGKDGTRLLLASMAVEACLPLGLVRLFLIRIGRLSYIDHVVAPTGELDLGEIMDQVIVTAVSVDDDDLLQTVPGDFLAGIFHQADDQLRIDADAAGVMACFQDLGEDEIREDNRRLQLGGTVAKSAPDEHIRAQRQIMLVALDTGKRQQAYPFGLLDGLRKSVAGQLLPSHGSSFLLIVGIDFIVF